MPAAMAALPGLDQQVRAQDAVAQRLRQARLARGALDFQTMEARPVFDGGTVRNSAEERDNRASNLIEDFMIAANSATAQFLEAHGFPSIRRVVRSPERWDRLEDWPRSMASACRPTPIERTGRLLLPGGPPTRCAFPTSRWRSSSCSAPASTSVDRPHEEGAGHFGLAVKDYTHSTAPNRRFPDLVTQRLVKAAAGGRPVPYPLEQLDAIAAHCTDMEDEANKVERLARRPLPRCSSVARSAASSTHRHRRVEEGTWVRQFKPPVEGRLSAASKGSTSATASACAWSAPTRSGDSSISSAHEGDHEGSTTRNYCLLCD